jgi:hypothetical protein
MWCEEEASRRHFLKELLSSQIKSFPQVRPLQLSRKLQRFLQRLVNDVIAQVDSAGGQLTDFPTNQGLGQPNER